MPSHCVGRKSAKCKKECVYVNNKGTRYCRKRSKSSCVGRKLTRCYKNCKVASGKSRTFCRRKKNRSTKRR